MTSYVTQKRAPRSIGEARGSDGKVVDDPMYAIDPALFWEG